MPKSFPSKILYTFFVFSILPTCPDHHSLLYFKVLTILSYMLKPQSSLQCNNLNCLTSSFLGPNIFLGTFLSNTCIYVLPSWQEVMFYNHIITLQNYCLFICTLIFTIEWSSCLRPQTSSKINHCYPSTVIRCCRCIL